MSYMIGQEWEYRNPRIAEDFQVLTIENQTVFWEGREVKAMTEPNYSHYKIYDGNLVPDPEEDESTCCTLF